MHISLHSSYGTKQKRLHYSNTPPQTLLSRREEIRQEKKNVILEQIIDEYVSELICKGDELNMMYT